MHARAARIAAIGAATLLVATTAFASAAPASPPLARASIKTVDRSERITASDQDSTTIAKAKKTKTPKPLAVTEPAPASPLTAGEKVGKPTKGVKPTGDVAANDTKAEIVPLAAPAEAGINAGNPASAKPGFAGIDRSTAASTDTEPPASSAAVGPEHVMQTVNSLIRITDRGGASAAADVSLAAFIQSFGLPELEEQDGDPLTTAWFDPRVIFDSAHGRWLVSAVGVHCNPNNDPAQPDPDTGSYFGDGIVFFATSDTIDPGDGWLGTAFVLTDYLVDSAGPGTSSDKFAFGWNVWNMIDDDTLPDPDDYTGDCLNPNVYAGTDLLTLNWTDWLSPGSFDFDYTSFGDEYFGPRVAVQSPATSTRLHVIVEKDVSGSQHAVYQSWTGSGAAIVAESERDLSTLGIIDPFVLPPQPDQPGSNEIASAVIDERPTDAIWQNDRMTWVSTHPCDPAGGGAETRDCVRVAQISTAGVSGSVAPTYRQDFLVGVTGTDNFVGGIAQSGNGSLYMTWTRSSNALAPGSYGAYQLPTDPLNSISTPQVLHAGASAYTGDRWGDHTLVAQDPYVPNQVWQANQYADGGDEWATHVSRLQTPGTTYVPIPPIRVLDSRTGVGVTKAKFSGNVPRNWPVAGVTVGSVTIDPDAVAVTGNVTVVNQTAGGYVAITPTDTANPPSSTINFPTGDIRANNVVAALSSSGRLSGVFRPTAGKTTDVIFDVTGYFLADATGGTYSVMTPARVVDSRDGTGGAVKFTRQVPQTFQVAGVGAIPSTATAVTGNLTVTNQTVGGYVSVTKDVPVGIPATSNINFPKGDNRANGLFAPLDATGKLSIYYFAGSAATTDVILDVTGYFEDGTGGLRFVPMNPARIMDSRPGVVLSGVTSPFQGGVPKSLTVEGHWGVPAGAEAITGNLTVVGQTLGGYIAMTPDEPVGIPTTSTMNFPSGDIRANGVAGPLNATGKTSFYYFAPSNRTTNLILDLSGYFE